MKYNLQTASAAESTAFGTLRKLWPYLSTEVWKMVITGIAIIVNSMTTLTGPWVLGRAIDTSIASGDYYGVLRYSALLLLLFLIALVAAYVQTRVMGGVAQRLLFRLRNTVFTKLQSLPVAFFSQNKAGDLISRINNDTDKLNQFFSQSLMQFIGSVFIMTGAAVFLFTLHPHLALAALAPAILVFLITRALSPWVKRKNANNLKSVGGMSAEVQESLEHFKVIIAFNRRDYFRERFDAVNQENYTNAIHAGIANNTFTPIYAAASNIAHIAVLGYGVLLLMQGALTVGLLISFLGYVLRFYDPLRHLAALWTNFQVAMAAWDRIAAMIEMENDLVTIPATANSAVGSAVLEFRAVQFGYPEGAPVLHDVSFALEAGKTYALVGPTGGGKTTTASLMARLYDPTEGEVLLHGRDIRSYSPEDRSKKIGFILQEPFMFTGTLRENIVYGNEQYVDYTPEQLDAVIREKKLTQLLSRFDQGLDTPVRATGDVLSLGQKQLVAFMRAVLRNPDILILDEATANIDTTTEQLLEDILANLPGHTTRVIIAHRLNTIENADEIFFVNTGEVTRAGSLQHAVDMLLHQQRKS